MPFMKRFRPENPHENWTRRGAMAAAAAGLAACTGPPVLAPTRQGFGSKLIPAALPPDLGRAEIIYAPEGVSAYLRFKSSGPGG